MLIASKSQFQLEPKMTAAADVIGTTATAETLRPTLGPVSALAYKPATLTYNVKWSQQPTTGAATVRLVAGSATLYEKAISVVNVSEYGQNAPIDLGGVTGQEPIRVELEMTQAADAGITATIDAALYVETPLTIAG